MGKKITLEDLATMVAKGFAETNGNVTKLSGKYDRLADKVAKGFAAVDRKYNDLADVVSKGFARVDQQHDALAKRMEEGFARVDQRFIEVDKRFEQIDRRFEQMDKRFDRVELRLDKQEKGRQAIRKALADQKAAQSKFVYRFEFNDLAGQVKKLRTNI
jgi:hypothetical protein